MDWVIQYPIFWNTIDYTVAWQIWSWWSLMAEVVLKMEQWKMIPHLHPLYNCAERKE